MANEEEEYVTLDANVALGQAAQTLERAADIADKINDVDAMMKIAAGWMEMHEYLRGGSHGPKPMKFGFCGPEQEEEELHDAIGEPVEQDDDEGDYADDDDEYADEGESSRRVYPQYGKFRVNAVRYRRRRFHA